MTVSFGRTRDVRRNPHVLPPRVENSRRPKATDIVNQLPALRFSGTLRPPAGDGVDEPDGAWQAGVGGFLACVGGFEGAPPDDELPDEGTRGDLFRGETGKPLQSKVVLDVLQAGKDVIPVRPEIDRPVRGVLDHALFAEFGDVGFHCARLRPTRARCQVFRLVLRIGRTRFTEHPGG